MRILFVLICSILGLVLADNFKVGPLAGVMAGVICSIVVVLIDISMKKISIQDIIAGVMGLIAGWVLAALTTYALYNILNLEEQVRSLLPLLLYLALGYLGVILMVRKGKELSFLNKLVPGTHGTGKILDTSVIIDGRIADIIDAGFIEGPLIVAGFVLQELQKVADSADQLKRQRGRRGLEILSRIQSSSVAVTVSNDDFPAVKEVDEKLIRLAKATGTKILTNDFNLNKIARLQDVSVLNINDLSNAVKPVVLAGETMSVKIIKEGKEPGQGIGYLEDGTMIVVDNGKSYIGRTIDIEVTASLQTTAGRMIFGRFKFEKQVR